MSKLLQKNAKQRFLWLKALADRNEDRLKISFSRDKAAFQQNSEQEEASFSCSQHLKLLDNLEKLRSIIKERDRRIQELLHYEYSAKKAIEQKTWHEEELEKERQYIKKLEKEKENQQSILLESRQHAQQLEIAVQYLQKLNEEFSLEKNQLFELSQEATGAVTQLNKDLELSKRQNQQLGKDLLRASENNEELKFELQGLYRQFELLKNTIEEQKKHLKDQAYLINEAKLASINLELEKDQLQEKFSFCQKEIAFIKQMVNKGLREARELENRYSEAIAEKMQTLSNFHQLQREFEKQYVELEELKEKLKAAQAAEKAERQEADHKVAYFKSQSSHLETELKRVMKEQEELTNKADLLAIRNEILEGECQSLQAAKEMSLSESRKVSAQLESLQEKLEGEIKNHALFKSQNEKLVEESLLLQASLDEKQALLDEAHQHLAKKVREVALLSERLEEMALQMAELESIRTVLEETNLEIRKEFEEHIQAKEQHFDKIHKQEKEIEFLKNQLDLAEKKARQASEKINELEKIEKCHAQLQTLLSNFAPLSGINMEVPLSSAKEPAPKLQFGMPLEAVDEGPNEEHASHGPTKAYANLFDLPNAPLQPKQNLFD